MGSVQIVINGWMNKETIELLSTMNKILSFARKWMESEITMLIKGSQAQTDK